MEGTFELMVSLGLFRNVDLYRQGIYGFRIACYTIESSLVPTEPLLASFSNIATRNTAVLDMEIPLGKQAIPYRISTLGRISNDDFLSESQAAYVCLDSIPIGCFSQSFISWVSPGSRHHGFLFNLHILIEFVEALFQYPPPPQQWY